MNFSKKSLGQNFLIDKNVIKKIVNLVEVNNKNIIEIGPGKGALTNEILRRKPKSLSIIEKDKNLANNLKISYKKNKNVKVYEEDILKFNIEKIVYEDSIIFGNLPYNISSQILVKLLKFKFWPPKFNNLILMFQKELGDKIIGKFNTNGYGRLSILSNYKLKLLKKFFISPNCFFPRPKVTSVVLHLKPIVNKSFKIKNIKNLEEVTNIMFSNKRKMIKKNIKKVVNDEEMKTIKDLNLNHRPSEVKPEIYYKITEFYEK
jgi:16S rRNA (adenine1518-N6/adenine1519-N6)-dimethyltransferase